MGRRKRTHWEMFVINLADIMIKEDWSTMDFERRMDIPHSSAHRYLTYYLPDIDYSRYLKCREILTRHRRRQTW